MLVVRVWVTLSHLIPFPPPPSANAIGSPSAGNAPAPCPPSGSSGACAESEPSSIILGASITHDPPEIHPATLSYCPGWVGTRETHQMPPRQSPLMQCGHSEDHLSFDVWEGEEAPRCPSPSPGPRAPVRREVPERSSGPRFPRGRSDNDSLLLLGRIAWQRPPWRSECRAFFLCPPGVHAPGSKEAFVCGRVSCFSGFLLTVPPDASTRPADKGPVVQPR